MSKRILIVDDDKAYALLIQYKLQNGGYESQITNRGSDAMRFAMEGYCDLILLDQKMPDVTGSRVCDNIRSDPKLKDLPIIIVTAQHELSEDVFLSYGATDVIYKPFADEELLGKVEKYLGSPS